MAPASRSDSSSARREAPRTRDYAREGAVLGAVVGAILGALGAIAWEAPAFLMLPLDVAGGAFIGWQLAKRSDPPRERWAWALSGAALVAVSLAQGVSGPAWPSIMSFGLVGAVAIVVELWMLFTQKPAAT